MLVLVYHGKVADMELYLGIEKTVSKTRGR